MSQSENSFRPLSWGLFFNSLPKIMRTSKSGRQFSPLSRGLFSMMVILLLWLGCMSFRPLSWGLSFNGKIRLHRKHRASVFVPFLGDFLSIIEKSAGYTGNIERFSSPFLGTFFQLHNAGISMIPILRVFVPFLGDFLSIP